MVWMRRVEIGAAVLSMVALAGTRSLGGQAPVQAPVPQVAAASPFPAVNPKNFTAGSPTTAEVNSFLTALWGYDENRIWSVAAIKTTPAPGMAKVLVYVADKSKPGRASSTVFYITPDGKHAVSESLMSFGPKPFEEARKLLQERAAGPAEGASSKDILLVEFGDITDPREKDAQATILALAEAFPQARVVFQTVPLSEARPFAEQAALAGVCVQKTKGDAAFFTFEQAVLDKQAGLTAASGDATLAAAVVVAGGDAKAVAVCTASPEAKEAVRASAALAEAVGAERTPMLVVNGHALPVALMSVEVLKKIVTFQAAQDGVAVTMQPSLSNLK